MAYHKLMLNSHKLNFHKFHILNMIFMFFLFLSLSHSHVALARCRMEMKKK
jgi:hypothetical protein